MQHIIGSKGYLLCFGKIFINAFFAITIYNSELYAVHHMLHKQTIHIIF